MITAAKVAIFIPKVVVVVEVFVELFRGEACTQHRSTILIEAYSWKA
jgi:hypothetical protein